ncbi:glycosyltransferase family 2 protein [Ignavibacterium sp.]|uniref:glycosyltransferase family 2 protein n=1 Tax=Ignavibacterium sp. TaxID=2651167 RepID=UPI00307D6852
MEINQNGNVVLLSIIIVNYNLEKEIDDCLSSLFRTVINHSNNFLSFEIIIVDNASPNKSLSQLESKYDNASVKFIYSEKNLGFGKGCNLGAKNSKGQYLLFLNPDTLITEDIFTPVFKLLQEDNKIGIIAPKQQVRKPFFDFSAGYFPNPIFELLHLFGIGVFSEGFLMYVLTKISTKSVIFTDWILGAAIFIKREIFEQVKGFDKDYFMFSEEVDLCKRVKSHGYKIAYFHKLKLHHIGSVSGKKNYFLYTIRTYASKYIFLNKHYKFLSKHLMISMLYLQIISQLMIWTLLLPVNRDKSLQKIKSFIYLIVNRMKNNIDIN